MKYICSGIETTGLNPKSCLILEIGMVMENTRLKLPREQCPTFHCYLDYKHFIGEDFALNMNKAIIQRIKDLQEQPVLACESKSLLLGPDAAVERMIQFISPLFPNEYKITIAGKNAASFDIPFLKMMGDGHGEKLPFSHRVIDPAMLFVDWKLDDKLPDLKLCKDRAGVTGEVSHNSLDDAWDVIQLLRTRY